MPHANTDCSDTRWILGTAGHIDHGKTALIRRLTGIDTDRLPQEKQRGITIDLGFAHLAVEGSQLGVVDVPGHERFVKNMLAGATGIDLVLLVVAADDGVMPQTREHLAICRLLDLSGGVIAITKADLADEERLRQVRSEIAELVGGSFLESAAVIETSVVDGRGLDELKAELARTCRTLTRRRRGDFFRLAIDRSFHVAGRGTVVSGTVWSGEVEAGDRVAWHPEGRALRVRGVQVHGQTVERATAGQRAAIHLADVHHHEILRGHELATPDYLQARSILLAQVQLLPDSPCDLKHRGRVRVHLGTGSVTATVNLFESNRLEPGESAWVQLLLASPVVTEAGQPLVLRHESPVLTIGGGHAWRQPMMRITRRQFTELAPWLQQLSDDDPARRAAAAMRLGAAESWTLTDLCRDAQLTGEQAEASVKRARQDGVLIDLSRPGGADVRVHREACEQFRGLILEQVERLHRSQPDRPMLPRSRVTARLQRLMPAHLIDPMLDRLIANHELRGNGREIAHPAHATQLTAQQQELRDRLRTAAEQAGLSFLDEDRLGRTTSSRPQDLRIVLAHLADQRELIHLGQGQWIHHAPFDRAVEALREAFQGEARLTMSRIRDILKTTRRYALPICEYLDAQGFTRRDGNERVWVADPATGKSNQRGETS